LKRAREDDGEAVLRAFLEFWRGHGRAHFVIEEDLLLPPFARHVPADDATIVQVLVQHVEIRRRVADMERINGTDVPALNALGELLEGHVRLEERILFPRMEKTLPPEEVSELGAAIAAAEAQSRALSP
jgi:hemerythrin-like domain-containing protein